MKCFRQLLRQPIKFIAGLVLMTMAAAIVCVCVGQALAARNTAEALDKQFTTVALAKGDGGRDANGYVRSVVRIPEEVQEWLVELDQSDSEIVKTVTQHGLLSASIPELTPLNYTQGGFVAEQYTEGNRTFYRYDPENDGRPYSSAMLVFTLEEVSESVELIVDARFKIDNARTIKDFQNLLFFYDWLDELGDNQRVGGYMVTLSGTVTDVISLQEGYRDPTGMTARLKLYLPYVGAMQAMDLEVGQSYLVYGMDYYDEDWAFRSLLAEPQGDNLQIDAFDPSQLVLYYPELEETEQDTQEGENDEEEEEEDEEQEEEEVKLTWSDIPNSQIVGRYTVTLSTASDSDSGIPVQVSLSLTAAEWKRINAVSMTLSRNLKYTSVEDYDGSYLSAPYVDRRDNVEYVDHNGEEIVMSWEDYTARYQIPTIARLEGSVEDFLQSEEGILWREALERDEVNHHAFAVLGVDSAMYLAWFAQEEAKITQGRDITAEEAESGAKVCIIHEAVALANALEIGDTVTLNLYQGDNGLPYQGVRDNSGDLLMPSADFYFSTTPIQETAEYTVVGLWRGPDIWPDIALNEYSLSPNTVIVPQKSVQTEWEHPNSILYISTILNNGTIQEFQNLTRQAGFNHLFTFFDQGYTELVGNFHDFEELARQVLIVGSVVYVVILLLFLLLFPGTQGKAVAIMECLGATRGKRVAHVLLSAAGIAAPATVLGGALGLALWQTVTDALQASAETTVALQLDPGVLLLLALIQFLLAMLLTAIIAIWVTAPKSLSKRRSK